MSEQKLNRLSLKDGNKIVAKTDKRYEEEVLGGKPSIRKIKAKNINPDPVTIMEWLAMVFVAGVLVYAWLKVQPSAVTYADTFDSGNALFAQATGVVFGLMATIGFIFMKIMSGDASVLKRQEENPLIKPYFGKTTLANGKVKTLGNFYKIEVWSPRMFGMLTYIILVWQIAIAITGIHNYFNPIEWLNALLPVLIEIGLATTIAKVLEKTRSWRNTMKEALILQKQEFFDKFDNRYNDEKYLTIMFQEMREKLSSMRGNDWLKVAGSELTRKAIMTEYQRLTAGQQFALDVFKQRATASETSTVIAQVAEETAKAVTPTGERVPPNGAYEWTTETLRQDFVARSDVNPNMNYGQKELDRDYASGYKYRNAFRGTKGAKDGAKHYFKTN